MTYVSPDVCRESRAAGHRPSGRLGGPPGEHRRGLPPRRRRSAPTGSSSTCGAPPTARWRCTTTPSCPTAGASSSWPPATCPPSLPVAGRRARRRAHGMGVNIEIKNDRHDPDFDPDDRVARGGGRRCCAGRTPRARRVDRVLVTSFDPATHRRGARARPRTCRPGGWPSNGHDLAGRDRARRGGRPRRRQPVGPARRRVARWPWPATPACGSTRGPSTTPSGCGRWSTSASTASSPTSPTWPGPWSTGAA